MSDFDQFNSSDLSEVSAIDPAEIVEMMRNDLMSGKRIRPLNDSERIVYGNTAVNAAGKIPAFTSIFALLRPFVDASAETCYVDEYGRVGLSYWFLYAIPREHRVTWLTHEAMHVLNSHFERSRSGNIDPKRMNICGDLEINTTLSTTHWAALDGLLVPEKYDMPKYKTMEFYHNYMVNEEINQKNEMQVGGGDDKLEESGFSSPSDDNNQDNSSGDSSDPSGESGNGNSSNANDGSPSNSSGDSSNANDDSPSNSSGDSSDSNGNTGNPIIDDMLSRFEKDLADKKKSPSPMAGNGESSGNTSPNQGSACDKPSESRSSEADEVDIERSSKSSQEIARQDTRERVKSEIIGGQGRGTNSTLNQFYEMVIELMQPPKVKWQDILKKVISQIGNEIAIGKQKTSFRRVNRRYSEGSNIIFPGTIAVKPTVMAALDNSGSMGSDDMLAGLIEINEIIEKALRLRDGMQMFTVDTSIHDVQLIKSVHDLQLKGGGGTDMSIAFDYVSSLPPKKQPDIFVLITDGELYSNWNDVAEELKKPKRYTPIILVTRDTLDTVPDSVTSLAKVIAIPLKK